MVSAAASKMRRARAYTGSFESVALIFGSATIAVDMPSVARHGRQPSRSPAISRIRWLYRPTSRALSMRVGKFDFWTAVPWHTYCSRCWMAMGLQLSIRTRSLARSDFF